MYGLTFLNFELRACVRNWQRSSDRSQAASGLGDKVIRDIKEKKDDLEKSLEGLCGASQIVRAEHRPMEIRESKP